MNKPPFINPQVFVCAAEMLSSTQSLTPCCCYAISDAAQCNGGYAWRYHRYLYDVMARDAFKLRGNTPLAYWYGDFTKRNKEARIMGLLLCAELAREGFQP